MTSRRNGKARAQVLAGLKALNAKADPTASLPLPDVVAVNQTGRELLTRAFQDHHANLQRIGEKIAADMGIDFRRYLLHVNGDVMEFRRVNP